MYKIDDEDLSCTSTTNPPAHSRKRVKTNRTRDAGDDPDIVVNNGKDTTKPKRVKKPADDDDDDGCGADVEECDEDGDAPQVSRKRAWTAEERTVVLRRMGQFVAQRKCVYKTNVRDSLPLTTIINYSKSVHKTLDR
ncbi:hypothetical protein JOB18_003922 [Solea senegalensis]|uniref:Uncharacterized protein n=1 Tax=Solea senegalensis TaxID=28829 RepID=A0AAV6RUZ9_SOLSE|nr:hypothetical protein JOB18_003922 [Solea senegalensis]